jgi:hypothetical protein
MYGKYEDRYLVDTAVFQNECFSLDIFGQSFPYARSRDLIILKTLF